MSQTPKQSAERSVPTSADVARLAGVSRATVSYVLNNTSAVRISEPTRRRVHEAAKELGYVPHAAARSLRAGHSRMVLMPAPTFPVGPLYSQFLNELQWALAASTTPSCSTAAVGLHGDEAARAWAELRPVAVLVPGTRPRPARRRRPQALRRPGRRHPRPRRRRGRARPVHGPRRRSAARAGAHLHDRGRRRIGVVVPEEPGLDAFSEPRLEGVRQAAAGHRRHGDRAAPRLRRGGRGPLAARWRTLGLDAVFAYNDEYAMLLMRALQDEGIAHPGGDGRHRRRRPDARPAAAAPAEHGPHRAAVRPRPRRTGRPRGAQARWRAGDPRSDGRAGGAPRVQLTASRGPADDMRPRERLSSVACMTTDPQRFEILLVPEHVKGGDPARWPTRPSARPSSGPRANRGVRLSALYGRRVEADIDPATRTVEALLVDGSELDYGLSARVLRCPPA